jgi:hypothetical protein
MENKNTATTAESFKTLFSSMHRGVKDVRIENGQVQVLVASRKTAIGIIKDMGMSRAFSGISHVEDTRGLWVCGKVC